MTNHSQDNAGLPDEPNGGWVTSPPLADNVIASLALCKFTGVAPLNDGTCPSRELRGHRDENCLMLYVSAQAIAAGLVPMDMPAVETRIPDAGVDATYTPLKRLP